MAGRNSIMPPSESDDTTPSLKRVPQQEPRASFLPGSAPGNNRLPLIVCAGGVLLGLLAFLPVMRAWFSSEELVLFAVLKNDPFAIWSGRNHEPGFFRPLIPLTAWIWTKIFGVRPMPFHALNILLHAMNAVMVAAIARRWVAHLPANNLLRGAGIAASCGVLFWLWPAHSEPVAWIPGLTDVESTVFGLGSILCYLVSRTSAAAGSGSEAPRTVSPGWLTGSVVLYVAALCTKEATITLPGAVGIYELMRASHERRLRSITVIGPLVFGVVMIGYFAARRWWTGSFLGGYGGSFHADYSWERLRLAIGPNLANAFLPVPGFLVDNRNGIMIGFAVVCAAILIRLARSRRGVSVAIIAAAAASMLMLLPAINLGPGLIMEGQRFAYFASALSSISLVFLLASCLPATRIRWTALALLMLAAGSLLAYHNQAWYRAGKMAKKIVGGMGDLPRARKLFVLATTDNYREAFIMPHSLQFAAQAVTGKLPAVAMPIAIAVNNWQPGCHVQAEAGERNGLAGWQVWLDAPQKRRGPLSPELEPVGGSSDWRVLAVEAAGKSVFVSPADYDPTRDGVVYLDGAKWRVVARPAELPRE